MDNKLILECECQTHILKVEVDSDDQSFYLAMFSYGSTGISWRYRLRSVWRILRKGSMFDDQIILAPDEAQTLASFILKHKAPSPQTPQLKQYSDEQ